MKSSLPVTAAKAGYIIMSAFMCLLGIIFIANPESSALFIGIALGVSLILFGVVKLVGYFSKDLFRLAFQYDLCFGILFMVLGTAVIINAQSMISFISCVIGIAVIADGIFKIQIANDSRRFGIQSWWLIAVFAAISLIIGTLLLLYPEKGASVMVILLGASILADGILNLVTILLAVKIAKNQKPDVIEITIDKSDE